MSKALHNQNIQNQLFLSANRRHDRIEISNQIGCCGIRFAKAMLRGIKPMLEKLNE
jgi:hypothetical protein